MPVKMSLVLFLCVVSLNLSAKTIESVKYDSLSQQVSGLKVQLNEARKEIELVRKELCVNEKSQQTIEEHMDMTNEAIANQLAASSHTIQIWGILFSLLAIVLSVGGILLAHHVNKMWANLEKLSSEVECQIKQADDTLGEINEQQQRVSAQQKEIHAMLNATDDKCRELQAINQDIQDNMQAIYAKLRREETIALLHRLESIPEDIVNVEDILLARNLEKSDYKSLRMAYDNLIHRCEELNGVATINALRQKSSEFIRYEEKYALLFAQHFMDEAIRDPDLLELMRIRFGTFYGANFFKNDAEKSTKDFKQGISVLNEELQTKLLVELINAIVKSRYEGIAEFYSVLLSDLPEAQIQMIWDGVSPNSTNAVHFAKYLKELVESLNPQSDLLLAIDRYLEENQIAEKV